MKGNFLSTDSRYRPPKADDVAQICLVGIDASIRLVQKDYFSGGTSHQKGKTMKSKAGRNGAMRVLVLGLGLFFMLCARAARTDPLPLGDGDWTIQAVAVGGGSISPAGVIGVADGGSQTFVMLPDTGCKIADALVNGVSVGAVTDWTFTGVAGDQTIEVVFAAYSGVTLKEHGEAGDWIPCETEDTYVSQQSSKERGTNFGAQEIVKCYDAGNGRVGAFRFDLDALPPVGEVLSASLRLYLVPDAANQSGVAKYVTQMDEAWVEGSGVEGSYDNGLITGSCWDAATPGTYVAPGSLEAYDHQGTHVFYATSVPGLAADPQNASGRYVRAGPGAYQVWNYPFTPAASLADLAVLQNANTLAYFHDEAEATLYVSHATKGSGASGMQGVRWFSNVDLFASPSGRTIGDTFPSQTAGNPKQGWYAFDVTSIVTNWLSGGHANHGFKVTAARYKDAYFASADRMDNAATAVDERLWRPELVVDYISPPAPGTLIVVR